MRMQLQPILMHLRVCSPAFRREHLLAAKQLLRMAIAPATAGTRCRNARFMGAMRKNVFRRSRSINWRRRRGVPPVQDLRTPKAGQARRAVLPRSWVQCARFRFGEISQPSLAKREEKETDL